MQRPQFRLGFPPLYVRPSSYGNDSVLTNPSAKAGQAPAAARTSSPFVCHSYGFTSLTPSPSSAASAQMHCPVVAPKRTPNRLIGSAEYQPSADDRQREVLDEIRRLGARIATAERDLAGDRRPWTN